MTQQLRLFVCRCKRYGRLAIILTLSPNILFAQSMATTLMGTVFSETDGTPLPHATVALHQNGQLVTGAVCDGEGKYRITGLSGGTYRLSGSYVGYTHTQPYTISTAEEGALLEIDFGLQQGITLKEVLIEVQRVPLANGNGGCPGVCGSRCSTTCLLPVHFFEEDTAATLTNRIAPVQPELQVFPNPAVTYTTVSFLAGQPTTTYLEVYSVSGQHITSVYEGVPDAGQRLQFRVATAALPAGSYFCRMMAGEEVRTRQFVVVR